MDPLPPPKPHSRLFVSDEGFITLQQQVRSDPVSRRIFECLRRKAEQFGAAPVCRREMEGRRLSVDSRAGLERILTLAMAARLSEEPRFARRAVAEMLAVAAFADWNPAHFLDTAEMTFALAVGYDWLHDQLSGQEREVIATALLEKGVNASRDENPEHGWWITAENNWCQVCHAGMVIGALALAERDPALAAEIVARAVTNLPRVARAYAPDGAYAEGPAYWGYGTSSHVALIAALESALGQSYGLADIPGFLASAHYLCQAAGPSGRFFNYSDCGEQRGFQAAMFWFARRLNEPGLAAAETRRLDERLTGYEARGHDGTYRMLALALVWYQPPDISGQQEQPAGLPRHWVGRGVTPVGFHRSRWDDPEATYVAIKGGSPAAPHAHMDAGVFVLEAGGVRWAVDLGTQEYHSLEKCGLNLWEHPVRQESDRWKVFRLNSQGHSVPNFNGAPQLVTGDAPLVRFRADGEMPHTVVDLSSVYTDHAARAWRGVALLGDGRAILQDEWTAGNLQVEMRWQMFTFADITLEERKIILRQDNRELELRVLEPAAGVAMEVVEKSEPAHFFDAPNPGLRVLVLTCPTQPGQAQTLRLLASLSTLASGDAPVGLALASWSSPR